MASTLTTTPTPTHDVDGQSDTTFSTLVFRPPPPSAPTRPSQSSLSSSPSHSSNSSFGSSLSFHDILDDHNNSPISPTTPLHHFPKGVPFSWEKIPGIPKQIFSKKNNTSTSLGQLLPLMPPPAKNGNNNIPNSSKKISTSTNFLDEFSPRKCAAKSFRKDPFFAAFVECSKDDHDQQYHHHHDDNDIWKSSSKVPSIRSLSDRLGFISMYTSCKRTCTVSESIVYLPRSRNYNRKY